MSSTLRILVFTMPALLFLAASVAAMGPGDGGNFDPFGGSGFNGNPGAGSPSNNSPVKNGGGLSNDISNAFPSKPSGVVPVNNRPAPPQQVVQDNVQQSNTSTPNAVLEHDGAHVIQQENPVANQPAAGARR